MPPPATPARSPRSSQNVTPLGKRGREAEDWRARVNAKAGGALQRVDLSGSALLADPWMRALFATLPPELLQNAELFEDLALPSLPKETDEHGHQVVDKSALTHAATHLDPAWQGALSRALGWPVGATREGTTIVMPLASAAAVEDYLSTVRGMARVHFVGLALLPGSGAAMDVVRAHGLSPSLELRALYTGVEQLQQVEPDTLELSAGHLGAAEAVDLLKRLQAWLERQGVGACTVHMTVDAAERDPRAAVVYARGADVERDVAGQRAAVYARALQAAEAALAQFDAAAAGARQAARERHAADVRTGVSAADVLLMEDDLHAALASMHARDAAERAGLERAVAEARRRDASAPVPSALFVTSVDAVWDRGGWSMQNRRIRKR